MYNMKLSILGSLSIAQIIKNMFRKKIDSKIVKMKIIRYAHVNDEQAQEMVRSGDILGIKVTVRAITEEEYRRLQRASNTESDVRDLVNVFIEYDFSKL